MPKCTAKQIHAELEKNLLWPVYWIYGPEQLKIRELLHRIRNAHLKNIAPKNIPLSLENFDADECTCEQILEAAQTLSLSVQQKIIIIRNAHKLKNAESLQPLLLSPPGTPEEVQVVCVFLSKDFDSRKKFSKTLLQKAITVECESVPEHDREAWIRFLMQRKEIKPEFETLSYLRQLEPWSLDGVEQELEKLSLMNEFSETLQVNEVFKSQHFMDCFFSKKLPLTLEQVHQFASQPEESIPLLGLLAWNLKNMIAYECTRLKKQPPPSSLHSFTLAKIQKWAPHWTLQELFDLENKLLELDFSLKQTPKSSLASWSILCLETQK